MRKLGAPAQTFQQLVSKMVTGKRGLRWNVCRQESQVSFDTYMVHSTCTNEDHTLDRFGTFMHAILFTTDLILGISHIAVLERVIVRLEFRAGYT
jgi:hypothetical protein